MENASYGLSICAERAALARAVAEGARAFEAIAITGPEDGTACLPCGACRQVLHELAPDLRIIVAAPDGGTRTIPLSALLPEAFDASSLIDGGRAEQGGPPTDSSGSDR